jgi:hypothetical protein
VRQCIQIAILLPTSRQGIADRDRAECATPLGGTQLVALVSRDKIFERLASPCHTPWLMRRQRIEERARPGDRHLGLAVHDRCAERPANRKWKSGLDFDGKPRTPHSLSAGWGGRIRTSVWRNQNPLPYHLATPQCASRDLKRKAGSRQSRARDQRRNFTAVRAVDVGVMPRQGAATPRLTECDCR